MSYNNPKTITHDGTLNGDGSPQNPLGVVLDTSGKYLISGGASWSGIGLTYDVSILTYYFNGNHASSATSVTLDPSDPTDNRFDAVVVDEAGTVTVITGMASSSPLTPSIPEDQLLVQYILVEAGSTQPTVVEDAIHLDEPTTNWTASNYTTAGSPVGSTNFSATTSPTPFQGADYIKNIRDARTGLRFVRASNINLTDYTHLRVQVYLPVALATNKNLNIRWENSSGTLIGNTVNAFLYGVSRTLTGVWQMAFIPIYAFGAINTVKGLKMILAGGTNGVTAQWNIDYVLVMNGATPGANVPTLTFLKDNVIVGAQSKANFITGANTTLDVLNNPTSGQIDITVAAIVPPVVVPDADYGDITVSGIGTVWTIDSNVVTFAKLQQLTTKTVFGNSTGSTANATAVPFSTVSPVQLGTTTSNIYSQGLTGTAEGSSNNVMLGVNAANGVTSGVSSAVFIGNQAGRTATSATSSVFIGSSAGNGATSSQQSVFVGNSSGLNATTSASSVMIGPNAGNGATVSATTVFVGSQAGQNASAAPLAAFIGAGAGTTATNAREATFIGAGAGNSSTNGSFSTFLGRLAGSSATNAKNSIFIGFQAGINDTVNNTSSGTSILIGNNTSTGGFQNSIAIGDTATNTAANQFLIGSSYTSLIMSGLTKSGFGVASPTGVIHLKAGTATANTAPLKFTSGTNLTTAEAGSVEFTTDDLFFTITTGSARKGIVLNNGSNLTSGTYPIATTNGRLQDSALNTTTLTATTYTPSATNVTNITSSTPNNATWQRVGSIVSVWGTITVTNTLAVASEVDISLPVASNLGSVTDLNGTATMDSTASVNIYIQGDTTNDRASIFFTSDGVGQTSTIYYSFSYSVI